MSNKNKYENFKKIKNNNEKNYKTFQQKCSTKMFHKNVRQNVELKMFDESF